MDYITSSTSALSELVADGYSSLLQGVSAAGPRLSLLGSSLAARIGVLLCFLGLHHILLSRRSRTGDTHGPDTAAQPCGQGASTGSRAPERNAPLARDSAHRGRLPSGASTERELRARPAISKHWTFQELQAAVSAGANSPPVVDLGGAQIDCPAALTITRPGTTLRNGTVRRHVARSDGAAGAGGAIAVRAGGCKLIDVTVIADGAPFSGALVDVRNTGVAPCALVRCRVSSLSGEAATTGVAVAAEGAGCVYARLEDCEVGPVPGKGVAVSGRCAHVSVTRGTVGPTGFAGAVARGGAKVELARVRVSGCLRGCAVRGAGSRMRLREVVVASAVLDGVCAEGRGAELVAVRTRVAASGGAGVRVAGGAAAELRQCSVRGSVGWALHAAGRGTRVVVDGAGARGLRAGSVISDLAEPSVPRRDTKAPPGPDHASSPASSPALSGATTPRVTPVWTSAASEADTPRTEAPAGDARAGAGCIFCGDGALLDLAHTLVMFARLEPAEAHGSGAAVLRECVLQGSTGSAWTVARWAVGGPREGGDEKAL